MTLKTILSLSVAMSFTLPAADLPIREVVLYKHGVAYFERSGELKPGESARLDFRAGDMNDILKSLTLADRSGGKIGGVRYDASEPLEKRLEDFPFSVGGQTSLAAFIDQMKGSRIELRLGAETAAGTIMSARFVKSADKDKPDTEALVMLMDSGDIRTFDLSATSSVRFPDPKLQTLLKDYLTVLSQARSKDRRSVYIDSVESSSRDLVASYMTPAAVWKSTYRLLFGNTGDATLEGWAIVDNTSGEDWKSIHLSVISGKPISFITQLYEPRYVRRPGAELAENIAAAPVLFEGALTDRLAGNNAPLAAAPPPRPAAVAKSEFADKKDLREMSRREAAQLGAASQTFNSTITGAADTRDAGELFEYSFSQPVSVQRGESAMLPFLQQKIGARKLIIYMDSFGLHPMDAAEITNSTGKTLDGGPFTVYDNATYAGEALVETLKAGDKRLISYGVDLGTRVSTAWDSAKEVVREIHIRRGILTARSAVEETKTYTLKNVDAKAKTVIIEHAQRPGYKLLSAKPQETTSSAYRFEVKLDASATGAFPVREERVIDQTTAVSSMTPDVLTTWIQNKQLSDVGRRQLEAIAQKKREVAANDSVLRQAEAGLNDLIQDQSRVRSNISSLNNVSGQQALVQQYAAQLASNETRLAALRDSQSDLRKKKGALEGELNALIERADF
jgi:hypothetical protein